MQDKTGEKNEMADAQTRALVYALARHVSAALSDLRRQVEDIRMQIAGPQNSQQAAGARAAPGHVGAEALQGLAQLLGQLGIGRG